MSSGGAVCSFRFHSATSPATTNGYAGDFAEVGEVISEMSDKKHLYNS
jgi:hypothetical protein